MNKVMKNWILSGISLLLAVIGIYIFVQAKSGMNFVTMPSFVLILGALMSAMIFYSKSHMAKTEPLAETLGLKITKYLSVPGKSRVDMRGDINGFEVFLRHKTFWHKMQKFEKYIFAIRIHNPVDIHLVVKPTAFLNKSFKPLPPKLYTAKWHWPDFIEVYGKPFKAINALLQDEENSRTFHHFFAKISCKVKGEDMEFYTENLLKQNFLTKEEVESLFDLGAKIALKIDHLSPTLK